MTVSTTTVEYSSNVSWVNTGTGFEFARMPDGAVAIRRENTPNDIHVIPDNIWASIVAHVSVRGEAPGEWYKTMAFHNDESAKVFVTGLDGKLIEK